MSVIKESSWHSTLPLPISIISGDNLISSINLSERIIAHSLILKENQLAKANYLIVDVRRTDFEDSFINGAINLPAQSFHQTLPSLIPILTQFKQVIFHCSASNGRGPRIAAYYQDALNSRGISSEISSGAILVGGVKEFSVKFPNLVSKL